MRSLGLLLSLIGSLGLSSCASSLRSESTLTKWTTGYWFWNGGSTDVASSIGTLDELFVQTGTVRQRTLGNVSREPWSVDEYLPDQVPAAREYWVVFRFEHKGV